MPIKDSQITAIIIAGGQGNRMNGRDKGLVVYKEKTLIEHTLGKISSQINQIKINANRNLSQYAQFNHPVINDDLGDFQGPLAGFSVAMKQCDTKYILTMPCDAPFLPDDYVTRMIKAMPSNEDNTIVVAHDGERLQAVHALIPISLIENLTSYLNNGDRKLHLWYKQNKYLTADFSDKPEAFLNINTEEQLTQLSKTHD